MAKNRNKPGRPARDARAKVPRPAPAAPVTAPQQSCFVIMPIGDQKFAGYEVSASDLKSRYSDLIREAILKARPNLDVIRADEAPSPGGITTDIFERLMRADYVVVDITYPNPNVFYELGIRHACRPGTIL